MSISRAKGLMCLLHSSCSQILSLTTFSLSEITSTIRIILVLLFDMIMLLWPVYSQTFHMSISSVSVSFNYRCHLRCTIELRHATPLVSTYYGYSSSKNPTSKVRISAVFCYQKIKSYLVGVISNSVTFLRSFLTFSSSLVSYLVAQTLVQAQ